MNKKLKRNEVAVLYINGVFSYRFTSLALAREWANNCKRNWAMINRPCVADVRIETIY